MSTYNSWTETVWGKVGGSLARAFKRAGRDGRENAVESYAQNSPRITKLAKIARNSKALIKTSPKIWSV